MSVYVSQYQATAKVYIPCQVLCMHCGCVFIYELLVTGRGWATGIAIDRSLKSRAEDNAHENLSEQLNDPKKCDAVPCPACFRYQPHMCEKVGHERHGALGCWGFLVMALALLGAVIAGFLAALIPDNRPLFSVIAVCGLILFSLGYLALRRSNQLAAQHDPNVERLDERQQRAKSRAINPTEYDKQQAGRAQLAYKQHHRNYPRTLREKPKKLVIEWYLAPTVFINGGQFSIPLNDQDIVTVCVPENTNPGDKLTVDAIPPNIQPFKVRVFAMRVHPDEHRLE